MAVIGSLVVERLRDNQTEYASLVNTFSNSRNVPKLLAIQDIAGCQYVYLFAADPTPDNILVNYYKVALKFEQSAMLCANKPRYDFQCTFLSQRMSELTKKQDFFYEHFNPDEEDDLI